MSEPNIPRFAFFGTPAVARDTLARLVAHGYAPAVVVTGPNRKRGRGLVSSPSEVRAFALENGTPTLTPEKLDEEAAAQIASYGCAFAIVVAYGKILPEFLINAFPKGVLNVHYSLLPKYRGASPVEAALLAGDTVTGVSIQKMVRELDAGDIVAVKEVAIEPAETAPQLRARLREAGAQLLTAVLPEYLAGRSTPAPQEHSTATRAKKIRKEDGRIELRAPDEKNWRAYRAYAEWPGAYFFARQNGKDVRVKITKASLSDAGAFVVERVVPEGKREMAYADWKRNLRAESAQK